MLCGEHFGLKLLMSERLLTSHKSPRVNLFDFGVLHTSVGAKWTADLFSKTLSILLVSSHVELE